MPIFLGATKIEQPYIGSAQLSQAYLGSVPLLEAGADTALHAIIPDANQQMQGVLIGTGPLAEARAAELLLPDFQGVYRTFGANAIGYEGGRFVSDSEVYADDAPGGNPLPEIPYAAHAPAATNLCPNNGDFTTWNQTGSPILTSDTGIDGVSRPIEIEDADGFTWKTQVVVLTADTEQKVAVARIKKVSDMTGMDFPMFGFRLSSGNAEIFVLINPITGEAINAFSNGVVDFFVLDDGAFWKIGTSVINDGYTNSNILLVPGGRQTFTAGSIDPNAVGKYTYDAIQVYEGVTLEEAKHLPPIFTAGGPVTIDSCALTLPAVNHSDAGDQYTLDVEVTGACNVLGTFLTYDPAVAGGTFTLTDGTSSSTVAGKAIGNHSIQIDYSATGGTMQLTVGGAAGAEVAYDGGLPIAATLNLFDSATVVGKSRDLRRLGA